MVSPVLPLQAVHTARRLSMEFQAFVVRTHALRKAFVSVKGFYFQAEVQGQLLTWLVPHQLSQASRCFGVGPRCLRTSAFDAGRSWC